MPRSLLILACALAACDEPAGTAECSSGVEWTRGDEESRLMHPGLDCVECHEREGEGPRFTIAGTVMGTLTDVDDCYGVQGVVVRITDADGGIHELPTNESGNFYTSLDLPFPYTAEIERDGQITAMLASQGEGSCNRCHAEEPLEGAPGRIEAP